jgi:hypothetical protein
MLSFCKKRHESVEVLSCTPSRPAHSSIAFIRHHGAGLYGDSLVRITLADVLPWAVGLGNSNERAFSCLFG